LVAVTAGGENRGLPSLHISRLRELLQLLHPDSLSEDDIDSGEVALYSLHGKLTWFQFEQWHEPYFKVDNAGLTSSSGGSVGERTGN
jgi:hypothetical protein